MTGRREILLAAGGAIVAARMPAFAQQKSWRIGWISPSAEAVGAQFLDALRQGLREYGYIEGRNLVIDARWGDDSPARIETQIAELVAGKPDVVVTQGPTPTTVLRYTTTMPVVFGFSGDPILAGLVKSFARPGGNLTGMSFMALELVGKRIELLKAAMPGLKRIAILANSQHPGDQAERDASTAAAASFGLDAEYFDWRGAAQLDSALGAIEKSRSEAAVMFPVQGIISNGARIAAWSVRTRIPAISGWALFAESGNLMSYGCNLRESFRRLASFVDRILKGARPADLPVELPQNIEMVINLKTAKALGISVSQSVMLRADRVIE